MKKELLITINGFDYPIKTPEAYSVINERLKLFDLEYKTLLKHFKKEIKNKSSAEIYQASLAVVKDRTRKISPEEIKMRMYIDCCLYGRRARFPFIPDPSTVRTYAREAAHITIQWAAKRKTNSPQKIRRQKLINDATDLYGQPGEKDKAIKTKIINHILKKEGVPTNKDTDAHRNTIQRYVNRYFKIVKGEK